MKKSIKSIAAAAAALTMALSCVPAVYSVSDVPAVQAEEESAVKYEFTEGKTVQVPYHGLAMFTDDDGTTYYMAGESGGSSIFTLDENGRVKNSYNVESYADDNGEMITGGGDIELKQCGDYLYLTYFEYSGSWYWSTKKNNVIVKLDKELNEIAKYNHERKARSIDTNGEKAVYIKGNSIYVCDIDGKNKKLLYSVDNSNNDEPYEQPLNSVAIAGNYVGFQKRTGFQNESDQKAYCGIIDIETGKITLHEQRSVEQVFSSNGNLVWYGNDGYDPDPEGTLNNVSSDVFKEGGAAVDNYFMSRYEYYDDSEIYVFDGENYSVIKSPDTQEQGYNVIIDNEGNRITTSYDGKGNQTYRIYSDGELIDELTVNYKGSGKIVANGGVLTICYDERTPSSEDWVGWVDGTPKEEVDAMIAEQAERAAKIREEYPMKSVTYTYKS